MIVNLTKTNLSIFDMSKKNHLDTISYITKMK